jgi:N-alpha-acetyltransferase 10/11
MSWPDLSFVAENQDGSIIGYVLAKIDENLEQSFKSTPEHQIQGHITSVAVERPYRHQGIAEKLMTQSIRTMEHDYKAKNVSLYVRQGNAEAIALYQNKLGFQQVSLHNGYYGDGENAYLMRKVL